MLGDLFAERTKPTHLKFYFYLLIYCLHSSHVWSARSQIYEGQLWTKIKTHIGLKVIRTQNSVCVRIWAHTACFWAASLEYQF
jgi:hypothetical protein